RSLSPMRHHPRRSTLFPYTTLFRSEVVGKAVLEEEVARLLGRPALHQSRRVGGAGAAAPVGREPAPGQDREVVGQSEHLAHLAGDRKSTRLNSSHSQISYAVFCLKK